MNGQGRPVDLQGVPGSRSDSGAACRVSRWLVTGQGVFPALSRHAEMLLFITTGDALLERVLRSGTLALFAGEGLLPGDFKGALVDKAGAALEVLNGLG